MHKREPPAMYKKNSYLVRTRKVHALRMMIKKNAYLVRTEGIVFYKKYSYCTVLLVLFFIMVRRGIYKYSYTGTKGAKSAKGAEARHTDICFKGLPSAGAVRAILVLYL